MTLRPIVTLGDPRLRAVGARIDSFGPALHELLDDMTETMRDAPGVGIAAQQVGEALQLCVIEVDDVLYEVANPEIVHLSGEQEELRGLPLGPWGRGDADARRARRDGRQDGTASASPSRDTVSWRVPSSYEYDHLQGELYLDKVPPETVIPTESLHAEQDEDEEETPEARRLRLRRERERSTATLEAATAPAEE